MNSTTNQTTTTVPIPTTTTYNLYQMVNGAALCSGFTSWSDLKTDAEIAPPSNYPSLTSVIVHPSSPLVLTQDFDIMNLLNYFRTDLSNSSFNCNYDSTLYLLGLSGMNVAPWDQESITYCEASVRLVFQQSNIDFYMNGSSTFKCSSGMIQPKDSTLFNLFTDVKFISENLYPTRPVCPFIFGFSTLQRFQINNQISTILINNLWQFIQSSSSNSSINSTLAEFDAQGYGFYLNEDLMHPLVFESVQTLFISRSIQSIQTDLFNHFSQLTMNTNRSRTNSAMNST
jgi:hypothetical protein